MTAEMHVARFPGNADQVAAARCFVSDAVGEHPCHDDAVLLVSEVATNALVHTASKDGWFTVIAIRADSWVHISVKDGGSSKIPCGCKINRETPHRRGVALVERLAERWGFNRESRGGTFWFELRVSRARQRSRTGTSAASQTARHTALTSSPSASA